MNYLTVNTNRIIANQTAILSFFHIRTDSYNSTDGLDRDHQTGVC